MDTQKAEGHLRLRLNRVMQPFGFYGLDVHIVPAVNEIVKLAKVFHEEMKQAEKEQENGGTVA